MIRSVWAKLSAFKTGTRGIVLYLVALLLVPFLVLTGVAVDMGQLLLAKNQLSSAIDAAALDIGADPGLTQAQAQTQAQAYVSANFSTQYPAATLSSLNVTVPSAEGSGGCPANTVCITASLSVNTAFMQIIGYNTLAATVSTQVTASQNNLEVVLVLDNTGSMSSMYGSMTGIQGLQLASTTLVNTLFASDPTHQYVKIGIVPFTDNVNVGTQYAGASWIDNSNAAGSMSQENIAVPAGTGLITFASSLSSATSNSSMAWGGCMRQRTEPYDVEDVLPDAEFPSTLFTPYFAPDEPDGGNGSTDNCRASSSFINSYLCDGTCWNASNLPADQACAAKYTAANASQVKQSGSGVLQTGPNFLCTAQPLIRLTTDQSDIINEISAMTAGGATVVPAGLMWGWHLLSPNGPFGDGVSYTNTDTIKVIILLTDGDNDVQDQQPPVGPSNGFNQSVYNAYGYGSGPHLNLLSLPSGDDGTLDQADYNIDQKEIQLCNNIKAVQDANGNPGRIQIYAIGFGNEISDRGLTLLQQCASNASTYFYNPTSEELVATFQKIAVGLSQLRISK